MKALRFYRYLGRASVTGIAAVVVAPALALALWPIADLDLDGRLSLNDVAVALHGFAVRLEAGDATAQLASANGAAEDALKAGRASPIRFGARFLPVAEASAVPAATTQ